VQAASGSTGSPGATSRGSAQETVETLGAWSGVPVGNGLTTEWHPTQMLADIFTMRDHTHKRRPVRCRIRSQAVPGGAQVR
jgi:ornithine carbamoyltransferase